MVNHPHITQQLAAARERELVAAAARARLVRELPASHPRLRARLATALDGRHSSVSTHAKWTRRLPSWRAS